MATVFDGNDLAYHQWLADNPAGYVLNSWRAISPSYLVLYRANCSSVRPDAGVTKPGGFTERRYIKVCAAKLPELQQWVRQHGRADGSFSINCSKCSRPRKTVQHLVQGGRLRRRLTPALALKNHEPILPFARTA